MRCYDTHYMILAIWYHTNATLSRVDASLFNFASVIIVAYNEVSVKEGAPIHHLHECRCSLSADIMETIMWRGHHEGIIWKCDSCIHNCPISDDMRDYLRGYIVHGRINCVATRSGGWPRGRLNILMSEGGGEDPWEEGHDNHGYGSIPIPTEIQGDTQIIFVTSKTLIVDVDEWRD